MTDRELMRQALEAIHWLTTADEIDEPPINAIITALRERLAQPVREQEPVAWVECDGELVWNNREAAIGRNLYTAPTPRKPLTEKELDDLRQADGGALNFVTLRAFRVVARAVERKHGITGETK